MCDSTYLYPRKGANSIKLAKVFVIVCSNKPPENIYKNNIELIYARFNVINLTKIYI